MPKRSGLILLSLLLGGCFGSAKQPDFALVTTPTRNFAVEDGFFPSGDGRQLHYVAVGEPSAPAVLFVHGTPGSWAAYRQFLAEPRLLERVRLLAVDRLGFGASQPGVVEPSLEKQAASLVPLLESLARGGAKPILVGHSYGGPVIARVAMDYPALVGGLVMVAPSIDPGLERLRWYNHVASWRLLNWLIPQEMLTSNREILPLRRELEKMLPGWDRIEAPLILIQGDEDKLVPRGNADFAARMLPPAQVRLERIPAAGHFVLWQQPELTISAVLTLLDSASRAAHPGAEATANAPLAGQ